MSISSKTCRWTKCPSELLSPERGFKLWPFDNSLTSEEKDNAMARVIVLGTLGTALYTKDTRVLVTGAGLLALLGIIGSECDTKTAPTQKQKLQQVSSQIVPVAMDPSAINVTAMGPIPVQLPEIPMYECTMQNEIPEPNLMGSLDEFALESANYLVASMPIDEDNRDYNPYGNPNVYQTHYAVDGNLPKQPNEMDIHAQILANSKMDIKKMFGKNGELDEGLFINPIPDPTLHARPTFFPESSDSDRPIWDEFNGTGNAYRQTM